MARALDLGEPEQPTIQPTLQTGLPARSCRAVTLVWNRQEKKVTTHVLGKAVASCGRASDRDVCLRVCPTSVPENAEKTRQISSLHILIRYIGDRLQVIDKGSTNGTLLSSAGALQPNIPADLKDGDKITIAEVLSLAVECVARAGDVPLDAKVRQEIASHLEDGDWLTQRLVGPSQPGLLDFARLRRIDNVPEEEYVLLFGVGAVGASDRALITTHAKAVAGPAVRTLDLGDAAPDYPAAFYWENGALRLRSNVADQVRVNGTAVPAGEQRILGGGETIEVLEQTIQVVAKP
jgi:hypothetical protein